MGYVKKSKFSYSKLNTFESCGWKYNLTYEKGHYIFTDSLSTELGTLLHFCEENIAKALKNGEKPDYEALKNDFQNLNIPKTSPQDMDGGIYGINILKEKYKDEFYLPDEKGSSYYTRTLDYLTYGIYRLEKFLQDNPDLEVYDMEKFFSVDYNGSVLSGYIDRIFHNKKDGSYIIEDIKTKNKLFKDTELTTPLQFVVYVYALAENLGIPYDKITCSYDLPFLDTKQPAGTPGFMNRGIKKLDEIFNGIGAKNFEPNPSPLCHFCQFCYTNPNAPEEGKYLCPYHSQWTRENRVHTVEHKWTGADQYDQLQKEHEASKRETASAAEEFDFDF